MLQDKMFENFIQDITLNNWTVHGVEIYSDGELARSFGDTKGKYPIYSATKTILSIAVGIAWDEGKINLDQDLLSYLPRRFASELQPSQKDVFGNISLHRLLTMSVNGFPFRPMGESFLRFSLNCPLTDWQTPAFNYSNISAYLVGVALTQAIGDDGWAYIENRILNPLGITGSEYERCPEGFFYGASGMKLSVNDLSRIGLLLYNGGTYEGKKIVSEEYIKKATSIQQMNREGGYGYFIWKYRDGFSINGKWGQKCYILPDHKLMVSFLCDIRDSSGKLRESMERNILGEV